MSLRFANNIDELLRIQEIEKENAERIIDYLKNWLTFYLERDDTDRKDTETIENLNKFDLGHAILVRLKTFLQYANDISDIFMTTADINQNLNYLFDLFDNVAWQGNVQDLKDILISISERRNEMG